MSDTVISVKGLSKKFRLPHDKKNSLKEHILRFRRTTYEEFTALKKVDFEVKRGEFFGIVGRNGSGKSTLLKLLAGIYQPSTGEVAVDGTLTPFIELGIGFNPELSGRDNVFLNGAILGLTRKEVEAKYQDIVDFAELEKFMDQKLKNYSSGMQVRLAFSIAIQAHNAVLLIDEVLAVGDAAFQRKCYEVFKDIKQSDKTVVFVSHDMGAIKEYCDRAILIEGGEIISQGDPDIVANDYMQLFNTDAPVTDGQGKRWGDRKVEISDIRAVANKELVEISYRVTANESVEDPIFGVIIKDLDNHHLFDSNTKWKKIKTGKLNKGQSLIISWAVPNIFKTGKYKVSPAAAHSDGLAFYDWQEEAAVFQVKRLEESAALILLDDKIDIKKVR
jgi:ABC-2 type transport system ATP-binding protein